MKDFDFDYEYTDEPGETDFENRIVTPSYEAGDESEVSLRPRRMDDYIGQDAFDESYDGFVPFADGSWISGDVAYDADTGEVLYLEEDIQVEEAFLEEMSEEVSEFVYINNLILETDYYEE